MNWRPIIAGLLLGAGSGAISGCAYDVGQSTGTDELGEEEDGEEEVGQVQEALKKKPKSKSKSKSKSSHGKKGHHCSDKPVFFSDDCGEDVEMCDSCSNAQTSCTNFHVVHDQCDVTESAITCSCHVELQVYTKPCEPDVGGS